MYWIASFWSCAADLLQVAAQLDRIDRAAGSVADDDPRCAAFIRPLNCCRKSAPTAPSKFN